MRSFVSIFLKGDLAEWLIVTLIGTGFVAAMVAVSMGVDAIGAGRLLEASGAGAVLLVGLIVGVGVGYSYWNRQWQKMLGGRKKVTEIKRVYLAARFEWKEYMLEVAARLEEIGITVTSRWIHGDTVGVDAAMAAKIDLEDLDRADTIVCFSDSGAGVGRHIEFGWALNSGRRLFIVGEAETVFHVMPQVRVCGDVDGLVHAISGI